MICVNHRSLITDFRPQISTKALQKEPAPKIRVLLAFSISKLVVSFHQKLTYIYYSIELKNRQAYSYFVKKTGTWRVAHQVPSMTFPIPAERSLRLRCQAGSTYRRIR